MDVEAKRVMFGEWLPDMPDLDNPGLTIATNVVPSDGGYRPFRPYTASPMTGTWPGTLPGTIAPSAGLIPYGVAGMAGVTTSAFVATGASIYRADSDHWTLRASVVTAGSWSMNQFDNYLIAASDGNPVLYATLPSGSFATLAASGTAPPANVSGVVGRFIVLGLTSANSTLQWSAINDPTNWPTPGTSTATATQAGEQIMPLNLGAITGIYGTDQYAIILQQGGVSRMQYIGGQVVFQFDTIDFDNGCPSRTGSVMVGGVVYYASQKGIYATDGTTVTNIGEGKVDKYFTQRIAERTTGGNIWCGYDSIHDVIYWSYADRGSVSIANAGNRLLLFHRASGRFSLADQESLLLITPASGRNIDLNSAGAVTTPPMNAWLFGLDTSRRLCQFAGTPGTATIDTQELELKPGGFSHVTGVKPLIEYTSTAPAVTVALSSRNNQGDGSITYPSSVTTTAATGFSDFRNSARYHRARIQITGDFERATGIEVKAFVEGSR